MKIKIVILGTAFPFRGGMAAFNERLAQAFIAEGAQVEIQNFKLQYPGFLFPGKTQYSESKPPENIFIESEISSINPLTWFRIGRKIKKQKPDLLIIGYWIPFMAPCFGSIAQLVKRNKKTNVISILHNIIPHEKRLGDRLLSNFFVKKTDAFVSLSKSVLEDLATFDKNKPRIFSPHPLYDHFGEKTTREQAIKELKLNPDFNYVLFFGLIRDYKGLDLLIDAFKDSRFKKMKIKLIIAGEFYSNREKYLHLIENNQLTDEIILHDRFIPDEQVSWYFGAADIIAQPYKNATQSGVTQIGYHFEKPMLVTNVGGLAEIIPHEKVGYVVEPNSEEIATCLIDFFENKKAHFFDENIRIEKQKYSWKTMTEAIHFLHQQLINQRFKPT